MVLGFCFFVFVLLVFSAEGVVLLLLFMHGLFRSSGGGLGWFASRLK